MKAVYFLLFAVFSGAVEALEVCVWRDEFDGAALDARYWTPETGFIRNVNARQMYREENIALGDGSITFTAKHERGVNPRYLWNSTDWRRNRYDAAYTSGSINSMGKVAMRYGRLEVRARFDFGHGMWPAIWLLGTPEGTVAPKDSDALYRAATALPWPMCGEIDVFEYASQTPTLTHATLHYGDHWEGANYKITGSTLDCPTLADGGWHTYGLNWGPDRLELTFDGVVVHTRDPASLVNPITRQTPFKDNMFHVILNLALGSMSEEPVAEDYPRSFAIDSIRLYQDPTVPGSRIEVHNENRAFTAFSSNDAAAQAVVPDCAVLAADGCLTVAGQPLAIGGFTPSQQFTLTLDVTIPEGEGGIIGFKAGDHTVQLERFGEVVSCRYDGTNASLAGTTTLPPGRHAIIIAHDSVKGTVTSGTRIWVDHAPFYAAGTLLWGNTTTSLITLGATAAGDRLLPGLVIHSARLEAGSVPKGNPVSFPFACHDAEVSLNIPADATLNADGSLTLGETALTLTGLSGTQALVTLDADLPAANGTLIAIHATQAPATPYSITLQSTANGYAVADIFNGTQTIRATPAIDSPSRFRLNYKTTGGTAHAHDNSAITTLTGIRYGNSTLSSISIGYPGVTVRGLALLTTAWDGISASLTQSIPLDASPAPDGSLILAQSPLTFSGFGSAQKVTSHLLAEVPADPEGALFALGVTKNSEPHTFQAEYTAPRAFVVRYDGTTLGAAASASPAPGIHAFTLTHNSENDTGNHGTYVLADGLACIDAPGVVWSGAAINSFAVGGIPGLRLMRLSLSTTAADTAADPLGAWTFPQAIAAASTAVKASLVGHTGAAPGLVAIPPVSLNNRALSPADAALALHLFGQSEIRFGVGSLAVNPPAVTLKSSAGINGTLTLLGATALGEPWQELASISAPTLAGGSYTLTPPETDCTFFKIRAEENISPMRTAFSDDPILHTAEGSFQLAEFTLTEPVESLTFTLSGAALLEGQIYTLFTPGHAFTATLQADATLTFHGLSALPAGAALTLAFTRAAGDPPGDLAINGSPVAHIATMIANTPKADGLATLASQQYRIPALATDGNGHTLAIFDVRYGGSDLGLNDGIDIGEAFSTDRGITWSAPIIGIDTPNVKNGSGGSDATLSKLTDIGDAAILYDPLADTYWLMAITGGGLSTPGTNTELNDVALYTRANTPTAPWVPWANGPSGNTRSVKADLISGIGGLTSAAKGILAGPGHGIICRGGKEGSGAMRGALVFPMQCFPNANFTAQIFAAYSLDRGATWQTTRLSSADDGNAQEGCIAELDDGSWLQMAKSGNNYRAMFRTTDFETWHKLAPYTPSTTVQGSCLRIGEGPDGRSRYVMAFCTGGASDRSKLRLTFGRDITHLNPSPDQEGIAWDCGTLMIHASATGGMGYNSLCLLDPSTLGILYEANKHIYFERIDLTPWLQ